MKHKTILVMMKKKKVKEKDYFIDGLNVVAMTTEILNWIYSDYR